ncbi:DUF5067 domain-containing protein [Companilactobacillus baiquanensis]|uniref:DUF5067 domain-containing protein n=2 Tax=Companilactobacillus baiquanensis TaxID=2486005 RepID=A0ABW1UT39_9LACO
MTRSAFRKRKRPFYKKKSFITIISLLVICLIGGGIYFFNNKSNDAPKVEHKASSKKTDIKLKKVTPKKKTEKKSKEQTPQSVKDETKTDEKKDDAKANAGSDDKSIKNAGSYNDLVYNSDWFTFKLSNDVKLVKDANGDPALMINYNYTNKTQSPQNPSQIQSKYMILKQDDQQLAATQATGDYSGIVDSSNKDQVQPGKSFDGALLVKVNNTDSDVIMSFLNIQTNEPIQTTQPFKLS